MKKRHLTGLLPIIFLVFIAFACHKSISEGATQPPPNPNGNIVPPNTVDTAHHRIPYPQTFLTECNYSPNYGDTIIFPQPTTTQDYIVSPINIPGLGRYLSWPDGLVIDTTTGAINVTKSESGQKFAIGFVKSGTTDTCMQNLIIAGASYMDSVYVLANNATKALPYFNANPNLVTANAGSKFDITKNAYGKKVSVDNNAGTIDLKQTLNGGAFGSSPYNGQTVTIDMSYTLNDASNNALQHIPVQLIYYYSKSQIGAGILNDIQLKQNDILSGRPITSKPSARPPLIIITRFN